MKYRMNYSLNDKIVDWRVLEYLFGHDWPFTIGIISKYLGVSFNIIQANLCRWMTEGGINIFWRE